MRFQDKIAIVTGKASGIGKEVATRFVVEGGSVVINGRDRSRPERGMIRVRTTTFNQNNELVQVFTGNLLVQRRPNEAAGQ
jgi:NAD(P)-dependent dehydrogenase (short-subunit alcohol dehydrogenase family)